MLKMKKIIAVLMILIILIQSLVFTGFAETEPKAISALNSADWMDTGAGSDKNTQPTPSEAEAAQVTVPAATQEYMAVPGALTAGITTDAGEISLDESQTCQIITTAIDADGNKSPLTDGLLYESSHKEIAIVSSEGIITAVAQGDTTVTVRYGDYKTDVYVKVFCGDKKIIGIKAEKQEIEIDSGDTKKTIVNVIYNDGTTSMVTSDAKYISSNAETVKVTDSGAITGVTPGKAVVTIAYKEFTTEIKVKVVTVLSSPKLNVEIQGGDAALNWTQVPEAKTYNVKRGTSPGKLSIIAGNIADTAFTDTELRKDITYFYAVTAENDGTESRNSNLAIRAAAPEAPNIYGLRKNDMIKINWTIPQDAEKFTLLRSTQAGGPYDIMAEQQAINQFEDSAVESDITYYYMVKPYDKFGREGEGSREIVVETRTIEENKFDPNGDVDGDKVVNEDELLQSTYSESNLQDALLAEDMTAQEAVNSTVLSENTTKNDKKTDKTVKRKVDKKIKRQFKSKSNKVNVTVYGEDELLKAPLEAKELDNPILKTLGGAVSEPVEISAGGVDINSAQITISYDKSKLNGIDENDLKIYWVDWDNKKLVPLEDSKVDTATMTVTATTPHFSTYILGGTMPVDFSKVDVVFIIDQSEGMSSIDPKSYRFKIVEKFTSEMNQFNSENTPDADKVRFALLGFSDYATEKQALTSEQEAFVGKLDEMKEVLGATNIADAIWIGMEELRTTTDRRKIIVLLTDGNDTCGNVDDQITQIVSSFQKISSAKDIVINTVAIGNDINEQLLKDIAEISGGAYFPLNITSTTTAIAADDMATLIYDKLIKQVTFDQATKPPSDTIVTGFVQKAKIKNPELYNGTDNRKALMLYTKNNGNLLTGNYIDSVKDITVNSSGPNLVFERTYNSDYGDQNTIIGNGWRTNYDTKLEPADVKVGTVRVDNLNVRTGPGTNMPIEKTPSGADLQLAYGSMVTITGDNETDSNGKIWYRVSFKAGSTEYINKYIASWYVSKKDIGIKITYGSGTEAVFIEDSSRTASGDISKFYFSPSNIYDTLVKRTNGTYALTKKNQTEYNYLGTGELKYIRDIYNSTLTLNYANGKLTEIHDPFGRKLTFQYNSNSLLAKVIEPKGRYTEFTYDSNKNLIGVNDLSGDKTAYTYTKGAITDKWLIKQEVDANGHQVIKNEYDKYDRLVKQYSGNNNVRYQIYKDIYKNEDGEIVTQSGSTTITAIDKELSSYYIDENGNESKVVFNPVTNNVTARIDAYGNKTTYRYYVYMNDDNNWIDNEAAAWTDITDIQEGTALEATYENSRGKKPRKEVITDSRGVWVSYLYDPMDNLVEVHSLKDRTTGEKVTESMRYDSKNNLISKTDGNNKTTTFSYENETFLKKLTDPMGNETVYEYYLWNADTSVPGVKIGLYGLVKKVTENRKDQAGNLITNFKVTEYKYEDGYNNRTEIVNTLDNHTKEKYDSVGRLIEVTDARNNTTKYFYDNMDRLVAQEDSYGNKNTKQYDNSGNKRFETDKNGNTTEYVYDSENQLIRIIDPSGYKVEYAYDASGNRIQEVNKKGGVTEYVYDALNRLISVKNPSNYVSTYSYDANGNLIKATDANYNETIYEYDLLNRKTKEKRQTGALYSSLGVTEAVTEYSYDNNDNIVYVKNANGIVTRYSYDSLNRNTSVIEAFNPEKPIPAVENGSAVENIQTRTVYDAYKDQITGKKFDKISVINAKNKTTVKEYDALGQLAKETDAKKNSISYIYDAAGNTLEVKDKRGLTTSYLYDKLNRVIRITDPDTYYMEKEYDASGNITAEKDKKGNRTEYHYNALNQIIEEVDPLMNVIHYTYDGSGNRTTVTDALGYIHGYHYNEMNQLVNETDGKGNTKFYWYDGMGNISAESNWKSMYIRKRYYYDGLNRLKQTVDQEEGKDYYSYDFVGNLKSYIDKNNHETKYDYDKLNRKTVEFYPGDDFIPQNIVKNKYDVTGKLIRQENITGTVDSFVYDELGRLLSHTQEKDNGTQTVTTAVHYDENGNKLTITDGNNVTTTNTYDELNNLRTSQLSVKNQDGRTSLHTTLYEYDKNGNLDTEIKEIISGANTVSNTYTYHYDELDRLKEKLDPDNKVIQKLEYYDNGTQSATYDALDNLTRYFYDQNNRLIKTIDAEGHETSQEYDEEGDIKNKTDARGNTTAYEYYETKLPKSVIDAKNVITCYTYDNMGNMLTQQDGKGNVTTFEYNAANRVSKRIDNAGTGNAAKTEYYTYYADGAVASKRDRNGVITRYEYDAHKRLIKQTAGSNEIVISYTYDGNGNQLTMTDGTGTTTRTYDELNRVTTKQVPGIGTSYFTYDIISGVDQGCVGELSVDPKNNSTIKGYDSAGRIKTVTAEGETTTYTYLDNGSRKSILYSDGSSEEYTYYKDGLLWSLTNKKADGTQIDRYTYEYDAAHNLARKIDNKGVTTYTYDEANRLKTVTEPSGNTTCYTYDRANNRETETIGGITQTYTYNDQNRLVSVTSPIETTTYGYDANGNQTIVEKNGAIITANEYDKLNRLIASTTNGQAVIYVYNGDGQRVSKTINGATTKYLYDYDKVVLETDGAGTQTGRNVYGANLLMRTADGTTYYYMYNGHADVTALLKPDGTVAATYYYDSFGNITDTTGSANNSITFSGYQYDSETGLYYLNARMYDPKTARFLQEDTYEGDISDPLSLNLYTYCSNEPLMYTDPTGRITVTIISAADAEKYSKQQVELRAQMRNGINSVLEQAYLHAGPNEIEYLQKAQAEIKKTGGVNAIAVDPMANEPAKSNSSYTLDDVEKISFNIAWANKIYNDKTPYMVRQMFPSEMYDIMFTAPSRQKTYETIRNIFGDETYQAKIQQDRQQAHDVFGTVGIISDAADIGDGVLYLFEGDIDNAKWALGAAIPFAGLLAKPAKKVVKGALNAGASEVKTGSKIINTTESPALKGSPYNPEAVAERIKPSYKANPAHDPKSPLFNPRKTPEPLDAVQAYENAVRADMGTWYGKGANGEVYRYFSDNAGGVHFSGIVSKESAPIEVLRQLGIKR